MLIIMSYYVDGSGDPELAFFPHSDSEDIAAHVAVATSDEGKRVEIWWIRELDKEPLQIYPIPEEA